MNLQIVSPKFHKDVAIVWLELNTDIGNFVIQPGHAPTVFVLAQNKKVTYCLTTGKQESVVVPRGIADITRTHATVIIHEEVK